MKKLAVISGKAGGLQAMLPMLGFFEASGRWEITGHLCDQHMYDQAVQGFPGRVFVLGHRHPVRIAGLTGAFEAISEHFEECRPDLAIVYGDRADALLGATVAHELGIPVAHLQAGDLTGGIDNRNRYATTALSTFAFCSTAEAALRVTLQDAILKDKNPLKVYTVGDHHLDAVLAVKTEPRSPIGADPDAYVLAHMHPDTLISRRSNKYLLDSVIEALRPWQCIWMPPCTDLHASALREVYAQEGIDLHPIVPLKDYVELMLGARCLVGNSSATILDAPALGVPVIRVGDRQRLRGAAPGLVGAEETRRAVRQAPWFVDPKPTLEKYGRGTAGKQTFEILDEAFA